MVGGNFRYVARCKWDHLFDEENTYIDKYGYQHCRTCHRERKAAARAQKILTDGWDDE